jgi:autotransporter-associated beta strand protein
MTPGTPFTILSFGSTDAGASNFTLANAASFRQGIFAVGANSITVDVGSKVLTWKGTASTAWDISTSANWADNGDTVEKYYQGDAVTFGDSGAGALTLPTGLTPYRVTVDSSVDYAFNGGSITSPNPLVKSGTGTLLLNTAGNYTGGVIVNGGTVALDGPRTYNRVQPNAPVVVNDGGTFEVRGVNAVEGGEDAIDVTLNQGGTLRVVSGNSALSTSTSHVHLRTLNLNGGTVDLTYSGSGVSYHNESFAIGTNGINVGGSAPSSIIMTGSATNEHVGIGLIGSRAFTVNDVTGSPAVDFLVAAEIEDGNAGAGSLLKMGTGTMEFAADTSYTGFTQISEGTLLVNAKLNGTTGVEVSAGATLGGNGTIALGGVGTISVHDQGTLAPGTGLGTLTIDSLNSNAATVLSLMPEAAFVFELNAGLQSDKIALTNGAFGDIAFSGNTIDFLDLSSGLLEAGTYTLLTADVEQAYTGLVFDSAGFITEGLQIGSGLEGYNELSLQLQGNDIVLNVVPEPASVLTLAGGVAMLLGMRRRRGN